MLKKMIFTALCLSPFLGHSSEQKEALLTNANHYVHWMKQLGESEDLSDATKLQSLCAPEIKRIFNSQLYAKNSDEFLADLLTFKEGFGGWEIRPIEIIVSPENQVAVVYYDISVNNLGDFTTIVILHFNEDHLITDINEVFSRSLGFSPFSAESEN